MARLGRGWPIQPKLWGPASYQFTLSSSDTGGGADTEDALDIVTIPSLSTVIDITPVDYDSLLLEWTNPSDTWDEIRLVRSSFGYPVNVDDGVLLFARTATPPYYTDTSGLRSGRFYYYSLFVHTVSYGWWRAGSAVGLVTEDFDTDGKWWDRTPAWYRQGDADQVVPEGEGPLRRLYTLLGYEHDRLRTEFETLATVADIDTVSGSLLPEFCTQFGLDYEPQIGMRQNRVLLKNIVHLSKNKGNKLGIEGIASALSGYGCSAIVGKNLLLTQDDARLLLGVGHWVADTNLAVARHTAAPAPQAGTADLKLTSTAGGDMKARLGNTYDYGVPVTVGTTYVGSAYFRTAVDARTCRLQIRWYDAAGGLISTTTGADITDASGSWTRAEVSAAAPALAAFAVLVAFVAGTGAGAEIHYACAFQFEAGGSATAWETNRDIKIYMLPVRTNHVPNPGAETNTTGWAGTNAALARVTSEHQTGVAALRLTSSAGGTMDAHTTTGTGGFPVDEESTYTGSAYFKAAATGRSCRVKLVWYDTGGSVISTSTGDSVSSVTTGWTRAEVTATAPALAVYGAIVAEVLATGGASEVEYVDSVLVEESASLLDYFDGAGTPDADYLWDGTTHGSKSYYYPNQSQRSQRISTLLTDYVPMDATYTIIYGVTTIPASAI